MKYDVGKPTSPKMPALGKGTECIKLLLSQVSKGIEEPMIPMFFPLLARTSAAQNYSIPTAAGRNHAA